MKVFEYAKQRNIKSKDVVRKLHELGFAHVKNHLSLIPEKLIPELDQINFDSTVKVKTKKVKDSKKIAFIAMECAPFVSKGLGDMVRNKIQYSQLTGNKNIVIIPKYNMDIQVLEHVMDINVSVYHQNKTGKVYKTTYDKSDYYLVDSDYFNRDKLYGFADDAERFAFLARAAIEIIKWTNVHFDVINVHDWPLGLFPILYKETLQKEFTDTKVEFSVYGATYSGIYGVNVLTDVFEINQEYYDNHTVEYANSVNFLKSGLITADQVDINKVALNDLKNSYLKDFVHDNM